jgi:hypothetical protein
MANKRKPTREFFALRSLAFDELAALVFNAVKIDGVTAVESKFIKQRLFEFGVVGYDKVTKSFAEIAGYGIDKYGEPISAQFIYQNGYNFERKLSYDKDPSGAYLIRSTPNSYRVFDTLAATADLITLCTLAIKQNIKASMRPNVAILDNKDLVLSVKQAVEDAVNGESLVVVSNEVGRALQGIENKTPFLADKFLQLRQAIRHEFLSQIGILTANSSKRERVQATEIVAGLNEAIDNIYSIIDYFNEQGTTYDLPFSMSLNGAIEELYDETSDAPQTTSEDLKGGGDL